MTKDLLASHRYAQAIFEIAREAGEDEYVESELEALSQALKSTPGIERFLGNPAVGQAEKRRIIERIFSAQGGSASDGKGKGSKMDETLIRFLLLLFAKGRFYLIHDIAVHFRKVADESQGQGVVEIRSAMPLKPEHQAAIVSRIEKISGKKMTVHAQVDESLIGGVVVKIGNKVIDDSTRTKIGNFKKELTKIQSI